MGNPDLGDGSHIRTCVGPPRGHVRKRIRCRLVSIADDFQKSCNLTRSKGLGYSMARPLSLLSLLFHVH